MARPIGSSGLAMFAGEASRNGGFNDEAIPALFSEVVMVHVKQTSRDEYNAALTVRLRPDNAAHPRNLLLELTDDADYLFYHSLVLGEGDFQALKAEQRLRVDFQTFPAQLVELLRRCMLDSKPPSASGSGGHPALASSALAALPSPSAAEAEGIAAAGGRGAGDLRMVAHLDCSGTGESSFTIVESTQFRELTHIALRLRQGSDDVVKQHLAGKLRTSRNELADLSERFQSTEEQLTQARRQVDELTARARVVGEERVHLERSLDASHQRELAELRAEHARALAELQRTAAERQERMEAEAQQSLNAALGRASMAERSLEELRQKQEALTSTSQSCRERLETAEKELRDAKIDGGSLREQVKQLESAKFQGERRIGELQIQVSGLQGELGAKEQLISNQASQLEQAVLQRRTLEEALAASKQQAQSLEEKFAMSAQEIAKGNQIIQTMHATSKQVKAKLKTSAAELARKEKAMLEYERTGELNKHIVDERENEIKRGQEREAKLKQDLDEMKKRLAEAHEVLKTNQDVIEYLNRQLTERDLKGLTSIPGLLGSTGLGLSEARGGRGSAAAAAFSPGATATTGGSGLGAGFGFGGGGGGMCGAAAASTAAASEQFAELLRRNGGGLGASGFGAAEPISAASASGRPTSAAFALPSGSAAPALTATPGIASAHSGHQPCSLGVGAGTAGAFTLGQNAAALLPAATASTAATATSAAALGSSLWPLGAGSAGATAPSTPINPRRPAAAAVAAIADGGAGAGAPLSAPKTSEKLQGPVAYRAPGSQAQCSTLTVA
eukprot:TRINITY_DN20558_c0_g1_i2.p1 TRINITY_DN20558_c0_g1~~TRINITY_DN20558_c0_g1_i2.p1  ORF type:complete len:792 (-),score=241.55 TRINITY_DN20558_c0_g1_i2:74-2449(-)